MPEGPGALVVGSPEPASDFEARALEVAVIDVVTSILSDVLSAQPVMSTVSERSTQAALLTPGDSTLLWSAHMPAGSTTAFESFGTAIAAAIDGTSLLRSGARLVWPLPSMGSVPSILASVTLDSAPFAALVCAARVQDLGATADMPPGLAPTSWANVVAVEEEEQEQAVPPFLSTFVWNSRTCT